MEDTLESRDASQTLDYSSITIYLESLLPILAGASPKQLTLLFGQQDGDERVKRFATDDSVRALYVNKVRTQIATEQESAQYVFTMTSELSYSANIAATVAFIKRVSLLDLSRPLDSQIHVLNLFGPASADANADGVDPAVDTKSTTAANPYSSLHSLVHLAVAPFFDAYVSSKTPQQRSDLPTSHKLKDADAKTGIPVAKKKFAELELSLLHLQQNVEVPDIQLSVHPLIQRIVDRCRADGTRISPEAIDQQTLSDSSFLNKIQAEVNSWIKEIQNVTKLSRDVSSGTASQEINFWLSMEKALEGIESQLKSEPILLTLDILRQAKRFQATVSFVADTGLKESADVVHKYNQLMKDFPLNELLAATDLDKIQEAIILIFSHLNKKLRLSPYPIRRALPLVEAISRDLNDQLLKVLSSLRLMYIDYQHFEKTMQVAATIFTAWDESIKEFTNVAREVTRKRSEKFLPIKINPSHLKVQNQVTYLRQFRKQHEQLRQMVSPTRGLMTATAAQPSSSTALSPQETSAIVDFDMEEEVRIAYESVKTVDVLDTSTEGAEIWSVAEATYDERIARVENKIISRLREQLGAARNAAAMFRVFSRFNALFVRPKIRGAIQEWQTQLIESVKDDIRKLQEKFKATYRSSQAYRIAQLRDIPPVSGAIMWAKQIERQLHGHMRRVEDVLGKGWELYDEGQKLQSESSSFRRKLDTRPIYEAWLQEINRRNLTITGRLFDIVKVRAKDNKLQLVVNFDAQIITLFKEVRNLIWLGFQIPHTLNNIAKDAKRIYPHAVALMEATRTYTQTVDKLAATPELQILISDVHAEVQSLITKGLSYRWEHFTTFIAANALDGREGRHGQYVKEFASTVALLQDRTEMVLEVHASILLILDELGTCEYDFNVFSGKLVALQKILDRLSLEGYANLEDWVNVLDKKVERILADRMRHAISIWSRRLATDSSVKVNGLAEDDTKYARLECPIVSLDLHMRNQLITLEPPLEAARCIWYTTLHQWLGVVCNLTRIQTSRYESGLHISTQSQEVTYVGLLSLFPSEILRQPFAQIEAKISEIADYVAKWLQFQALWDLEAEAVYSQLGESLERWQELLIDIRKTRSTFDTSEVQRSFQVATVRYEAIQTKINAKYDSWQRDILSRFGSNLGAAMRDQYSALSKVKRELEDHSIEASSTAQTVTLITFVQDLEKKLDIWTPQISTFEKCQTTLERYRFSFPNDWLYFDQIDGEWTSFKEILARKNASIQEQLTGLQMRIIAEDKIVANRVDAVLAEWAGDKPIQGGLKVDMALNTVNAFEARAQKIKDDLELVSRAKEALSLELVSDNRLDPVLEEIRDLKGVWTALSGIWSQIADMRDTVWTLLQPRKLRQQLDTLQTSAREMPSRMRQYAAYEYVQDTLRQYLKTASVVSDLKSEAMKERHWRQLFRSLRPSMTYIASQLTLGAVWDFDLKTNEAAVREVITRAQGELALEEFLKQIKETWTSYALDLVNYQNKTRLIRGWDDLFSKCSENVSSLAAMKHSPFFRVFEEEALNWEDKLTRVHALFDVWIDVQRQWVYLEGIFSGGADIKHLLPIESSRFNNIQNEFLTVMKKVSRSPFVLDVLNIEGVQKSLERLAELLNKIQKALGEYLERERSSFPRYYFVGDEDLLEIIGNSKDVVSNMKHLKKMFAGISSLVLDDEHTSINGMVSAEGEQVDFSDPIMLKDYAKVNDWLSALERAMKTTLARQLIVCFGQLASLQVAEPSFAHDLLHHITSFPSQIIVLAAQLQWTSLTESGLSNHEFNSVLLYVTTCLDVLASSVLQDLDSVQRRKIEHLVTEMVHERDILRNLASQSDVAQQAFLWQSQMRFYLASNNAAEEKNVTVRMAAATFEYGYEYLGLADRLVQTPLTDRCYLTLTQALCDRLGGSPFGPAGTGKTESVKALGLQLGKFVLVFCCDENFDFQAMGRIFVGLCQVGAWGCFDEFNRLEERMLSAVSQQIQTIQTGLANPNSHGRSEVTLVGKNLTIDPNTGIFITMNPGYAGRSNLPDNLKKLFRSISMTRPDRELIAQVMLFTQGFRTAETLASKVVPFFVLCAEQLSTQPHYDFGLRALKAVLISAGQLKRRAIADTAGEIDNTDEHEAATLVQSIMETVVPKLVATDVPLLESLVADVFPGVKGSRNGLDDLAQHIATVCKSCQYIADPTWLLKVMQLYQIQSIQHGVMLVGSVATGKTSAWTVLARALEQWTGIESVQYVIDPKAVSKEDLYGTLDPTTREWKDGLFTSILRKIVDNVRGEDTRRHWIVFDGDVDPEWVENLNSVLDDNKLLTLPNGERLGLPSNVRIMFEVDTLKYATLATVSRCGMVWFSEGTVTTPSILKHHLNVLRTTSIASRDEDAALLDHSPLAIQSRLANYLEPLCIENGLVQQALEYAAQLDHIMEFTAIRAISTFFSLLSKATRSILDYNFQHADFPLQIQQMDSIFSKRSLLALVWAFAGDAPLSTRIEMSAFIGKASGMETPRTSGDNSMLLDFDVSTVTCDWTPWQKSVPAVDLETHAVLSSDVVIPTVDTLRHEDVLYAWLAEHKPLILCGPPGSGKTMTLFSALRKLPDLEMAALNFSSATTPALILKTFEQYCEYRKTPSGVVLSPPQIGRWVVIFCDEINLPTNDKYGTQRVISFLRQLVQQNGFWRTSDQAWVRLERIQFVGACNPPTDPGRVPLSPRFLRHAPVVMVGYPGPTSLQQIYGSFNRAAIKVVPSLSPYSDALTSAMVDFFGQTQTHFTPDMQPHYIYSPRELTRWVRGIYEAIQPLDELSLEGLVRIWAHEALRLFSDRLVAAEERSWTDDKIASVASTHFPTADLHLALARPILFSNWTSRNYVSVDQEELREFTKARLRIFYEEELDVQLVLFDDVLQHALRIDRVFRQVQGHLLLIGVSGSGKTTLSRFVAWMNGFSIFQIKVSNRYTAEDFDEDLRSVLRRAGCKGEKICFIMDESNVLDSGFLERMNTLLANAEIPGLFEGDEYSALMTACRDGAQRDGVMLDSTDEMYRWFTQQVARNLHVVFTMNPPGSASDTRATTSPALFNRCVLDWFGDWSDQALHQVAFEFTATIDFDESTFQAASLPDKAQTMSCRDTMVNSFVHIHRSIVAYNESLVRKTSLQNTLTPRHYLDFLTQYTRIYQEKRDSLEEQQRHLNTGLDKLSATVKEVEELRKSLAIKRQQLTQKDAQANEKLLRMVADQQEAESGKAASLKLQQHLAEQNVQISERRSIVMVDLAAAEPAVLEAQAAVSNIKKQHLTEVRSMANPPEAVKLAMESICTVLGHKIESWKTVQSIIRRDDFISSIVNFDTTRSMTGALRNRMLSDYLSRPNYNFEAVNRASKACGPLVSWVIAQVSFSEILDKVGPLREEVSQLEEQAAGTQSQADATVALISNLEASISQYKEDYAALISETQQIKSEMERVQQKVDRSINLLESLASERERWDVGSKSFEEQMRSVAGDVLLSVAYLTYAGYFDQSYRKSMWREWSEHLETVNIFFRPDLSFIECLSTADARSDWQQQQLPVDDLCTENAIMLDRFNRYPLIIDPSGQAKSFLLHAYRAKKISVTSFLDAAFLKNLESALRFGTPLLVQDVEHLDPILNAVLNKELRKAGGRTLIRLGNQDIDFSPSFQMFLLTRDPSASFTPDICSRTTMINFTMTRSSLQSQILNQTLRVERPDVDDKRSDLLRVQGEFGARLRTLEKALLQALNTAEGNILNDDKIIAFLEKLKREGLEIASKMQETDVVAAEVGRVLNLYQPLAAACGAIYFALDQLQLLNHMYQFSLHFFMEIFNYVLLHNPRLKAVQDPRDRLLIMINDLFLHVFKRTSRTVLHADQVIVALVLARIKLLVNHDDHAAEMLDYVSSTVVPYDDTVRQTQEFSKAKTKLNHALDISEAYLADLATSHELGHLMGPINSAQDAASQLLLTSIARPDKLLEAGQAFAQTVLGFDVQMESDYDLRLVCEEEISASNCIVLASVSGFDAAFRIERIVNEAGKRYIPVAMGSSEGLTQADGAIATAAKTGQWVLLKNCHLALTWLDGLEKRMQTLSPHQDFRLILTLETSPRIPTALLRQSRVFMNEPTPGLRANLIESLQGLSPQLLATGPAEKARALFMVCWLHAVLTQRLQYAPLAFTKRYEFNDADFAAAIGRLDSLLSTTAKGKSNLPPNEMPWHAIRAVLSRYAYGGRIDVDQDQLVLDSLISKLINANSYEIDFPLSVSGSVTAPEGTHLNACLDWARKLPAQEPPETLGLPQNAAVLVARRAGIDLLARFRQLQTLDDSDATANSNTTEMPSALGLIYEQATAILQLLPKNVQSSQLSQAADPLERFFHREAETLQGVLGSVRDDLQAVIGVGKGDRQTNGTRRLLEALLKGSIPANWSKYRLPQGYNLQQFAADLCDRISHLTAGLETGFEQIKLAELCLPSAWLTATRQVAAHSQAISLERLSMVLAPMNHVPTADETAFTVDGLSLQAASYDQQSLVSNSGATTLLGPMKVIWTARRQSQSTEATYNCPVYLFSDRVDLLFTANLAASSPVDQLVQNGVAIICGN